jgi:hypothetical protein
MTKEMDDSGNLDIDFCLPNQKQSVPSVRPSRRIEKTINLMVEQVDGLHSPWRISRLPWDWKSQLRDASGQKEG